MQLIATLLSLFLLSAPAFATDVNSEYLGEVCQNAYSQDREAATGCVVKATGLDSQASLSDRDIYIEIVGQATEAETAPQTPLASSLEKVLQVQIEACKSTPDLDACLLKSLDNERAQLSRYLDTLEPALGWDDDVRFALFHIMLKTAEGESRCESLDPTSKPACLEQIPMIMSRVTEEALRDLSDTRTYRASHHVTLRNLEVERRIEAQREHDKELARNEATARRLQGFALRGGPPSNTFNAAQYQPMARAPFYEPFPASYLPPLPIAPSPINPAPPPVSCATRNVGRTLYTDCY